MTSATRGSACANVLNGRENGMHGTRKVSPPPHLFFCLASCQIKTDNKALAITDGPMQCRLVAEVVVERF